MSAVTLSIIIPYYKEHSRDIFPLLASINGQVGVNFEKIECILVNDGGQNQLPQTFLQLFAKLSIHCIFLESNQGPGVARQKGLDDARGDYVMFCDADDTLQNVGVLDAFFKVMTDEYPDMIGSPWFEECYDGQTGVMSYVLHEKDYTWLHGKVFLRSFLTENQIRFHEQLRVHEDTFFLALVAMETTDIHWSSIISYIWKYRTDSLTRQRGSDYYVDSILQHIRALSYAYAMIEVRHPEKLGFFITEMMVFYYFNLHHERWSKPNNEEPLLQAEFALCTVLDRYREFFDGTVTEEVESLYNRQREQQFHGFLEQETFYEWLSRLSVLKVSTEPPIDVTG